MHRTLQIGGLTSLLFWVSVSMASLSTVPLSDQHVVWQRTPIQVTLPVGKERFVSFPAPVQFGYNQNDLPSSVLRVQNDHRTLYLLAKKPFATQRVEAKLSNGDIILLDMKAKAQANDNPLDIVLPALKSNRALFQHQHNKANLNYVTLTRYAIQQLYAPQRLLKQPLGITRFPMEAPHVVPLFYDGSASAMPLASWRGNDYYVTALLIKNNVNQLLRLDPRVLCGHWKTASFYPNRTLAPRGTAMNQDTSSLFVVSHQPFSQAIQPCLPPTLQ